MYKIDEKFHSSGTYYRWVDNLEESGFGYSRPRLAHIYSSKCSTFPHIKGSLKIELDNIQKQEDSEVFKINRGIKNKRSNDTTESSVTESRNLEKNGIETKTNDVLSNKNSLENDVKSIDDKDGNFPVKDVQSLSHSDTDADATISGSETSALEIDLPEESPKCAKSDEQTKLDRAIEPFSRSVSGNIFKWFQDNSPEDNSPKNLHYFC